MITIRFSFVFVLNVRIFQRKTAAHESRRELPAAPVPRRQHSAPRAPLHTNLTVGAQALHKQVRAEIYCAAASFKHAVDASLLTGTQNKMLTLRDENRSSLSKIMYKLEDHMLLHLAYLLLEETHIAEKMHSRSHYMHVQM